MMPNTLAHWLLIMFAILLTACSSTDEEEDFSARKTEEVYYDEAQVALNTRNWQIAIENLQGLEEYYPFGKYAEQAQLELIYAYHMNSEHEASIAASDRFIRLHPQHPNVDYAYYMKGLTTFTEGSGMLERFLPTDMSMRDPGAARQSFTHFSQLLSRFPNSPYAPDARQRMIHLRNQLARYEIHAANYYMKRGAWVAAAARGRNVIENFPQTPAVPDALAVTIQSYNAMGSDDLSNNALAVLRQNYPEHPALTANGDFNYDYARESSNKSLLHTLTLNLFRKNDPRGFDSRDIYNPGGNPVRAKAVPAPNEAPETVADAEQVSEDNGIFKSLGKSFDTITFGLFSNDDANQEN